MKDEIKFIKYNGIEGYIELMKHDVEPLNNPECKRIELYYDGKDIKAVLDYITNLQKENKRLHTRIKTIKRRKAQTAKMRKYREEITKKQNSIEYYKSIIDKAIEFINTACSWLNIDLRDNDELLQVKVRFFKDILNILKGENNESKIEN